MYELTQGTIISGIRAEKYQDTPCNAVVISARCDIAQCKISHIYYVVAMDIRDWMLSNEGFHTVLAKRVKELESQLSQKISTAGLSWETLKTFSAADFKTVLFDEEVGLGKNAAVCLEQYSSYKKYQEFGLSIDDKKSILLKEKNSVNNYILDISNRKISQYVYLPITAYCNEKLAPNGLIVDLHELDRFDIDTAKTIANCNMDIKSNEMTATEKQKYNKQFLLLDAPGYAIAECVIESPWIEYLMQHFGNSFTRIGVDNPQKTEIKVLIDKICEEEEL